MEETAPTPSNHIENNICSSILLRGLEFLKLINIQFFKINIQELINIGNQNKFNIHSVIYSSNKCLFSI